MVGSNDISGKRHSSPIFILNKQFMELVDAIRRINSSAEIGIIKPPAKADEELTTKGNELWSQLVETFSETDNISMHEIDTFQFIGRDGIHLTKQGYSKMNHYLNSVRPIPRTGQYGLARFRKKYFGMEMGTTSINIKNVSCQTETIKTPLMPDRLRNCSAKQLPYSGRYPKWPIKGKKSITNPKLFILD